MAVEPGTTIRHYEVHSLLGSGGMGQVYRARDKQLGRDVAVKVISPSFAGDRDRLQRLAREAQVLASLNHPNIGAIYGVEECEGVTALILELVPGQTLAELLAKGPLSIRQALDVAKQMAYALESAHERGIIHRDIKPANIKLTGEGVVKVLDFGLAKDRATDLSSSADGATTAVDRATEAGVILGTTAYMSPEQASGQPVDRRADIWAFGCVLYEMLTGRRAFSGDSFSDLLSAVLTGHADLTHLPAPTPPRVREVLKRCLDRDPKQRLRDIGEARVVLERPAEVDATPGARAERKVGIAWLAAGIAGGVLLGIVSARPWTRKADVEAPQAVRLVMPLAPSENLDPRAYKRPILRAFAISRDGGFVVFAGTRNNRSIIFRRRLSDGSATPIAGTEDGRAPVLSP
jgi:serine/threonine protein kinase